MRSESHYRIKDSVSLFARKEKRELYTLEFLFLTSRKVIEFCVDTLTFKLIKLCDGTRSIEEISSSLAVELRETKEVVRALVQDGILEFVSEAPLGVAGVFSRQLNFFAEFENSRVSRYDLQEKTKAANVLVLGLGGIGSWVTRSLAQAGVGALTLVDPDTVSETNITHQSSFSFSDVGKRKVSVLERVSLSLNPDITVKTVPEQITRYAQLVSYLSDISVVANCADFPDTDTTNEIVSRACFATGTPHVLCGGYDGHVTSIGQTVIPRVSSCWRCYVESGMYEKLMRGFTHIPISRVQREGGTLAPIAAISGNIQALEILRVVTGYQKPHMLNKKGEFDFGRYTLSTTKVPRLRGCSLCGKPVRKGWRK